MKQKVTEIPKKNFYNAMKQTFIVCTSQEEEVRGVAKALTWILKGKLRDKCNKVVCTSCKCVCVYAHTYMLCLGRPELGWGSPVG